jgi:hypothetical protein
MDAQVYDWRIGAAGTPAHVAPDTFCSRVCRASGSRVNLGAHAGTSGVRHYRSRPVLHLVYFGAMLLNVPYRFRLALLK